MNSEQAEHLGSVLSRMARDLADARRQIMRLTRENAALRAELGRDPTDNGVKRGFVRSPSGPDGSLAPRG